MFRLLEDVYSPIDSETKDHLIDELYIVMMNVL